MLFQLRWWEERKRGERTACSREEGGGELTPGQSGLHRTEAAHRNHARSGNTVPVVRFLFNCRIREIVRVSRSKNCSFLFLYKLSIYRDAMLQVYAARKNIQPYLVFFFVSRFFRFPESASRHRTQNLSTYITLKYQSLTIGQLEAVLLSRKYLFRLRLHGDANPNFGCGFSPGPDGFIRYWYRYLENYLFWLIGLTLQQFTTTSSVTMIFFCKISSSL